MNFEEALSDLIDKHLTREGYDGIISSLELKLMAIVFALSLVLVR